jgi:hypothetical protein
VYLYFRLRKRNVKLGSSSSNGTDAAADGTVQLHDKRDQKSGNSGTKSSAPIKQTKTAPASARRGALRTSKTKNQVRGKRKTKEPVTVKSDEESADEGVEDDAQATKRMLQECEVKLKVRE